MNWTTYLILKHNSSKTSIDIPFYGSLDIHRVSITVVSITNHWDWNSFIDETPLVYHFSIGNEANIRQAKSCGRNTETWKDKKTPMYEITWISPEGFFWTSTASKILNAVISKPYKQQQNDFRCTKKCWPPELHCTVLMKPFYLFTRKHSNTIAARSQKNNHRTSLAQDRMIVNIIPFLLKLNF